MANITSNSLYLVKDKTIFILESFIWEYKQIILQNSRPLKHSPYFIGFHTFYRIPGLSSILRILQDFTGFQDFFQVSRTQRKASGAPHFTGFYRILRTLQHFTGYYRILQDSLHFTGFYRISHILQDFTGFSGFLCPASSMLMERCRFLIFQIFELSELSSFQSFRTFRFSNFQICKLLQLSKAKAEKEEAALSNINHHSTESKSIPIE